MFEVAQWAKMGRSPVSFVGTRLALEASPAAYGSL